MRERLQRFWYARRPSALDSLLGAGLAPLSWAYRAGLTVSRVRSKVLDIGCPVISVGNLTVGGSGKTPLVVELARMLGAQGHRLAVISRGYGRQSHGTRIVRRPGRDPESVPAGGDEPVLIARKCPGVAVVVGEDRVEAGRLAVSEFSPDVVLCDDAFQHRRLKRDLDILAVHAGRGLGNGRLFPRGPLREPRRAMERADLVVFTHAGDVSLSELRSRHRVSPGLPAVRVGFEPGGFVRGPALEPAGLDRGTPVVAACAVADPQGFFDGCVAAGLRLLETRSYPDHHRLGERELAGLERLGRRVRARAIVVTEKDLVGMDESPELPVYALALTARWIDRAGQDTLKNLLVAKVGDP